MNQQERDTLKQVNDMVNGLEGMVNSLHKMIETHFKDISPEQAIKLSEELKKQDAKGILSNIKSQYEGLKNI